MDSEVVSAFIYSFIQLVNSLLSTIVWSVLDAKIVPGTNLIASL